MFKLRKSFLLKIALYVALAIYISTKLFDLTYRQPFQTINDTQKYGFEPTDCWFDQTSAPARTDCYYMHVPEDHAQQTDKAITFPVVVFRSDSIISTKAPVLHLGAGGPGAAMPLDYIEGIKAIWKSHRELSTDQGRDLFVIDPRGAGLSKPLLTCDTFVESEEKRLKYHLSVTTQWQESGQDYVDCIAKFKNQGVKLSTYNSLSIAHDIEKMRMAANVEEWVLIGVSYAATYAQIIATQYPDSVEAMVLDSATFPNLKAHDNFLDNAMAGYLALYDYCNLAPNCYTPLENIEKRIWHLHEELNLNPIKLELDHPYKNNKIDVLLNGDRFISALWAGLYDVEIFADLRHIIPQLEKRSVYTITSYLENHIDFLLDPTFGDVSMGSHYCYDDKPYTDFESLRIQADKLPKGYLRDTALLALDFPHNCDEMLIGASDPIVSAKTKTDIPTLFLHGELDTITPLSDVTEQRKTFTKNCLVTYKLSHSVLGGNKYAQRVAAKFIGDNKRDQKTLDCSEYTWL
tara:strand:+ start:1436 stop:2989 length:1554 start_codon:yes stop_codon:yes gene_type:complete